MKTKMQNLIRTLLCSTASLALLLAVNSVSNNCCFLSYQPDVPEELL